MDRRRQASFRAPTTAHGLFLGQDEPGLCRYGVAVQHVTSTLPFGNSSPKMVVQTRVLACKCSDKPYRAAILHCSKARHTSSAPQLSHRQGHIARKCRCRSRATPRRPSWPSCRSSGRATCTSCGHPLTRRDAADHQHEQGPANIGQRGHAHQEGQVARHRYGTVPLTPRLQFPLECAHS